MARNSSAKWSPGPIDFFDFVPTTITWGDFQLTVVIFYATSGVNLTGTNLEKYAILGAFLLSLGHPWLVVGDFNMTPKELQDTDWGVNLGATFFTPTNTLFTCRAEPCRMIDYAIAGGGTGFHPRLSGG